MTFSPAESRVRDAIAARAAHLLEDLRLHVALATGGGVARSAAALDHTRALLTMRARALGAELELVPGEPRPAWLYGSPGYGAPPASAAADAVPAAPLPTAICRRDDQAASSLRPLLIAGHLDTVHDPAGPFQSLTLAPDGKTATGPGCVDMKGGLIIALAALEALDACGIRLPWTLLLNSDEETGSYHSERVIFAQAQRIAARRGVGIALEPAGLGGTLITHRAGSGQFFIEVRGRAAHVGREFRSGISAVNALAAMITRIAALSRPDDDLIINIGPIDGGHATNVVPDRARAWGNVRFPTQSAAAELEAALRRIAAELIPPGAQVRLEVSFIRAAKPLTPAVERLASLAQSVSRDLGRELPLAKTAGVCDGNVMQAAGLPTLDTLGVRGGGLHTLEEWIELDTLVERCQLLALFMMRASEQSD